MGAIGVCREIVPTLCVGMHPAMLRVGREALKGRGLFAPFPLGQTRLQRLGRVDLLLPRTAEQDQHQLCRRQCIGAGMVAFASL